ncbi:hypothetical protein EJ05DRAFT_487664 [Pseudovirgaria hyperparasitica]|uniref:Uncharacterized protein n=1 Tax=Pseudovirgaria hyperparasitica TaxID=470096 RepID=A0A6A6W120_9PEZI|nr:uncharacterized protein EJ05DRAFT_487664 [Pseudovirgaria hyperparasitica]KAF2755829.1 hypothetical protein EJ05DRAFT_487664 [Pseudovirgaria hyperparasitica]
MASGVLSPHTSTMPDYNCCNVIIVPDWTRIWVPQSHAEPLPVSMAPKPISVRHILPVLGCQGALIGFLRAHMEDEMPPELRISASQGLSLWPSVALLPPPSFITTPPASLAMQPASRESMSASTATATGPGRLVAQPPAA